MLEPSADILDKKARDETPAACPACQALQNFGCGTKNGCELFRCATCRTLYAATTLPGSRQDYDGYYHAGNLTVPSFVLDRVGEIVAGFSRYRQENRFLDLGCGAGVLMDAAARAGWEVCGLDVSRKAVEHLRRAGYDVFHGELLEAGYPEGHFDVVAASELLEHVTDPRTIVAEVARILRPGGLFWATTPNGWGLSARLLAKNWSVVAPPEHLQLFTNRGIKSLLSQAGFRRISIATYGVNPIEILHHFRRNSVNEHTSETNRSGDGTAFDRVSSSYRINDAMVNNFAGRMVKYSANGFLNLSGLGDSLKIRAVR